MKLHPYQGDPMSTMPFGRLYTRPVGGGKSVNIDSHRGNVVPFWNGDPPPSSDEPVVGGCEEGCLFLPSHGGICVISGEASARKRK